MPRKLLTSGEVADELGLSPRTISRYTREGWITPDGIAAGGQYRFKLDRVREELRKRAVDRAKQRQRDEQHPASPKTSPGRYAASRTVTDMRTDERPRVHADPRPRTQRRGDGHPLLRRVVMIPFRRPWPVVAGCTSTGPPVRCWRR
ncbi:MAG: helix-turn-helix domain-containing protein [Pseudonocardiaceae bacterium]